MPDRDESIPRHRAYCGPAVWIDDNVSKSRALAVPKHVWYSYYPTDKATTANVDRSSMYICAMRSVDVSVGGYSFMLNIISRSVGLTGSLFTIHTYLTGLYILPS